MARWGVTVRTDVGGIPTFNTFQVEDIAEGGGPLDSRAFRIHESWVNTILSTVTNDAVLRSVTVRSQDGASVEDYAEDRDGALGGDALPVNCGLNYIKNVASGRRGRMFIAGFAEQATSPSGQIDTANVNAANLVFQLLVEDLAIKNLRMTKDALGPLDVPVPVTSASCGPYIVRQSRRLDRARY